MVGSKLEYLVRPMFRTYDRQITKTMINNEAA